MDFMSQRWVCLPHQQSYICKTKENRGNFIRWVRRGGNCIARLQIRGKKLVAIKRLDTLRKRKKKEGKIKAHAVRGVCSRARAPQSACPNILAHPAR